MVPAYIWLVVSGQDVGRSVELGNGCRRLKQQAKIHSPRIHPEVIQQWHGVVLNFHVLPTDVGLQHNMYPALITQVSFSRLKVSYQVPCV